MAQSIKKNFIYSSILTVSNYLFPLITFPYISRVLGVTNIGICDYVDSIINYFVLFSMMGISATGIREIAAAKGDKDKLSRTFSSLLCLNFVFCVIAFVGLIVCIEFIPDLQGYRRLLYIGASKLIGNVFLFEWLYKGMEDFAYITKRTLLVKCLYVISIFVFVRNSDDYMFYYILLSCMVVVNAFINCFHSRKYVTLMLSGIDIKPYIKSFLTIGSYLILTSFYTSFNVIFLGYNCGDTQVGYYTTATKLFTLLIALYTAFTGVMLPRLSALRAEGKYEEFKVLVSKSIELILCVSIPIVTVACIFTPDIVSIISGKGFEGAFLPTRIIMPLILIIGLEQILVLQILMPLKNDRAILANSIIGASVGFLMNVLLVKQFQAVGSACVWLCSEFAVLCVAQYFVRTQLEFVIPLRTIMKYIFSYLPCIAMLMVVYFMIDTLPIIRLTLAGGIVLVYTVLIQNCYLKSELYFMLEDRAKSLISRFGR